MSELKVYIVIRKDLKMRRGKEIAQACHAIQYLAEIGDIHVGERTVAGFIYKQWCENQHAKIAVGVESEQQLNNFVARASELGVLEATVLDAGRTEIPENTLTCAAIGPITNEEADLLGLSGLPLR